MITRRDALRTLAVTAVGIVTACQEARGGPAPVMEVTKDPGCGCCDKWAEHFRTAGFTVNVKEDAERRAHKARLGIPAEFQTCHTGIVEGYVVDGHVPADLVRKMLAEKPAIRGLAVPGMPIGSPGMEGPNPQPYDVIAFTKDGQKTVYARR